MSTNVCLFVYLCLPMFNHYCLSVPIFTPEYSCFPMFCTVYSCMFNRVESSLMCSIGKISERVEVLEGTTSLPPTKKRATVSRTPYKLGRGPRTRFATGSTGMGWFRGRRGGGHYWRRDWRCTAGRHRESPWGGRCLGSFSLYSRTL